MGVKSTLVTAANTTELTAKRTQILRHPVYPTFLLQIFGLKADRCLNLGPSYLVFFADKVHSHVIMTHTGNLANVTVETRLSIFFCLHLQKR